MSFFYQRTMSLVVKGWWSILGRYIGPRKKQVHIIRGFPIFCRAFWPNEKHPKKTQISHHGQRFGKQKLIHLFHPFCPTQRTWNWTIIWEWLGCDTEILLKNNESVFEKTDMYRIPVHTHLIGVWFPRCLEVSTRQHWRRGIPVLICACFQHGW